MTDITTTKQVVSMLASEKKITLFTIQGEMFDLKVDGPHDTVAISDYLTPLLTGTGAVEINLNDYLTLTKALGNAAPEYEEEGIITVQIIDGKEVQGIFYPQKVSVTVQHEGEKVEIPAVENLTKHIERAHAEDSPAVRNFLRRMAHVAKHRLHSAQDLMAFIERSELPLTNDGRIIGYKRVNESRTKPGHFVDVHSGNIHQRVGSRVFMDVDAVDPSRNNSCSHGLHVANLGYLSSFRGTHTLIVLVDPADFIAVPHGETNKCRVCSYDIIGVMSSGSQKIVDSGQHVEGDNSLENIIARAVAGNVEKPFEKIKVGTKRIESVTKISGEDVNSEAPAQEEATEDTKKSSGKSLNTDQKEKSTNLVKKIKAAKAAAQGKNLWDDAPKNVIAAFEAVLNKTDSVSMASIAKEHGTSTRTIGRWQDKYDFDGYAKTKKAAVAEIAGAAGKKPKGKMEEALEKTMPTPSQKSKKPADTKAPKATAKGGVREQGQALYSDWQKDKTEDNFDRLLDFKKAKKKGWAALGFNTVQVKKIERGIKAHKG